MKWSVQYRWSGPNRLEVTGKYGVPQVISVGTMDMVNFRPRETVAKQFNGKNFINIILQ